MMFHAPNIEDSSLFWAAVTWRVIFCPLPANIWPCCQDLHLSESAFCKPFSKRLSFLCIYRSCNPPPPSPTPHFSFFMGATVLGPRNVSPCDPAPLHFDKGTKLNLPLLPRWNHTYTRTHAHTQRCTVSTLQTVYCLRNASFSVSRSSSVCVCFLARHWFGSAHDLCPFALVLEENNNSSVALYPVKTLRSDGAVLHHK